MGTERTSEEERNEMATRTKTERKTNDDMQRENSFNKTDIDLMHNGVQQGMEEKKCYIGRERV